MRYCNSLALRMPQERKKKVRIEKHFNETNLQKRACQPLSEIIFNADIDDIVPAPL